MLSTCSRSNNKNVAEIYICDGMRRLSFYARGMAPFLGRIPAVDADVFRSSVRHCIIELRISEDTLVLGAGTTNR